MVSDRQALPATAAEMASRQREISVSEFFLKNRHLLGFDTPAKALVTAVKEAVDNALDACEGGGGVVTLSASHDAARSTLHLAVTDNGPGVAPCDRSEIFNPFFSTKGPKGNGLGLTLVQKIVNEHHGTVELDSQPGRTRFTIVLPQA